VAESRTASPGDTVLLPVKLENAQGIGSLGYSVQYDPLVIEYVKADKGSIFSDDTSFVTNVPQPGTIIIAYATSGAVSGSGTAASSSLRPSARRAARALSLCLTLRLPALRVDRSLSIRLADRSSSHRRQKETGTETDG
jgi:hypothetical protein